MRTEDFSEACALPELPKRLKTSEAKKRIWRNGDEKYYPGGAAAPDYCMVKFTAAKGRHYSSYKSEGFKV